MSADEDDGPIGTREVANRVFAAEYDQANVSFKEGEEERAPSYVVTPSGAKANRLFFVGVLTEIEDVNEDMLRARVVDPTGAFVVYAGQYQPDARTFFERASPPEFVAVSGKARTFQPDDSDRVFTSVRPESVNAVDADTRDRWTLDAAEATLGRVAAMARALRDGADEDPAAAGLDRTGGIALALDNYGTTPAYLAALRDLALDVAGVVAGDRDEVRPLETDPGDPGPADLDALVALADSEAVAGAVPDEAAAADEPATATADDAGGGTAVAEGGSADAAGTETETGSADADATADVDAGSADADAAADASSTAETDADAETAADSTDDDAGTADEATADATTEPSTAGSGADASDEVESGADAGEDAGTAPGSADAGEETGSTDGDDLGDFEPGGGFDEGENGDDVEVEGNPDEMYELDEDERREVEEEYGTEFSTGTEVDAPGEAGIETPDPEDVDPEAGGGADADTGAAASGDETAADPDADDEPAAGSGDDDADEASADDDAAGEGEDVDLDEYVIDRMREMDDGDGADREKLVAAVVDETGADPGDVEDAIQDALMGGQCYEPDDGALKPI